MVETATEVVEDVRLEPTDNYRPTWPDVALPTLGARSQSTLPAQLEEPVPTMEPTLLLE